MTAQEKQTQRRSAFARWLPAALLGGVMLAGASTTSVAAPKENLFLKYHITTTLLKVATLRFEIDTTDRNYSVRSVMKTKGLISFITSSEFQATTAGLLKNYAPRPTSFDMVTDSRKHGERRQTITWNKQRLPQAKRSWNLGTYKTNTLKQAIAADMPDPVSALLTASFASGDALCRDRMRVFDGKTIYELSYRYMKRDDFGKKDPGVYRGEAHQCRITYTPVAGLSAKKWKKLKSEPNKGVETVFIWMAPVQAPNLQRTVFIPVGAAVNLDGRQIDIELVAASMSGKPLNKLSRTSMK